MTQERMESVIKSAAKDVSGAAGGLSFTMGGVRMECISDVTHDRMRLIAPIKAVSELTSQQVASILEANFHTALDSRYATSHGVLYAAYIHPLSPLGERELQSALRQVAALVTSFGTTYSSGELVYSPGQAF